jgi:hypothetical protein
MLLSVWVHIEPLTAPLEGCHTARHSGGAAKAKRGVFRGGGHGSWGARALRSGQQQQQQLTAANIKTHQESDAQTLPPSPTSAGCLGLHPG